MLVTAVVSLWHYDSFQVGVWRDDASYLGIARALCHPGGYDWLIANTDDGFAVFPPGYPLVLTPLVVLFPGNLLIPQLTSLLFTLLSVTILYWGWPWFAPGMSQRWCIAVTFLFGVSRLTVEHSRMIMSEPLFLLLVLLALLAAERASRGRPRIGQVMLLGVLLAAALLVRSVGVILVFSVLAYLFFRQRRQAFIPGTSVLVTMAVTIAVIVWLTPVKVENILPGRYLARENSLLQAAQDALAPLTAGGEVTTGQDRSGRQAAWSDRLLDVIQRYGIYGIIQRFGLDLRSVVLPLGGGEREARVGAAIGMPFLPRLVGFFVSAIVWLGLATVFYFRRVSAFWLFGVVYLATTVLWVSAGPRLFYPIAPQMYFAFLLGIDAILRGLAGVTRRIAPLFPAVRLPLFGAVFLVLAVLSVSRSLRIPYSRDHTADLQARTRWLSENSSLSDTIMSELPVVDFVYSGRGIARYPDGCPGPEELATFLARKGVDYVLIAPESVWSAHYVPAYTATAQCVLNSLRTLGEESGVEPVLASEVDRIQVYRIHHE